MEYYWEILKSNVVYRHADERGNYNGSRLRGKPYIKRVSSRGCQLPQRDASLMASASKANGSDLPYELPWYVLIILQVTGTHS